MLSKLLSRLAPPQNSRDRLTISRVARDLKELLWLPAGGLVAGAFGVNVLDSRMGRVLVEMAGAALVVGLVHAGATVRRLQREMAYRVMCRSKRLALPPVLAAGITAAEIMDVPMVAEAISVRISKMKDFNIHSVQIFDCILFDLLNSNPTLSKELRQIARAAQRNP